MGVGRRALLVLAAAALARAAGPKGDPDWEPKFHRFVKQLNLFIISLNDGVFDSKQWKHVEQAWAEMEGLS